MSLRTFLAIALELALGVIAAGARPLSVTFGVDLATWHDPVRLRVVGDVVTSCGAGIVHLANLHVVTTSGGSTADVDLVEDACGVLAPPTVVPFALEADLGRLPPGGVDVAVHDVADGSVTRRELTVHRVPSLRLDLPELVVSGTPVRLGLLVRVDCAHLDHIVSGNLVQIRYAAIGCDIEAPPPRLTYTVIDLGPLPAGDYEVRLLDFTGGPLSGPPFGVLRRRLRVWKAEGCVPEEDRRLCLQNGRFLVAATWRAFDGSEGVAHAAPLPDNEGSGQLWFFAADNSELTIKILNGCSLNANWWVFLSSASTVEYEVSVTDTSTGTTRKYHKALGEVPKLVADAGAFPCT